MKTDIEKYPLIEDLSAKKVESSHSFLHALSGSISDAVIITDKQLLIEYWNNAATQLFGFSEAEAIDKHLSVLVFQNYNNIFFEKIFRQLADKEKWEEQLLTNQKKLIDCTFLVAGCDKEKITRIDIICKDNDATRDLINEKNQLLLDNKLAENEILLLEPKLRSILNNSIGATFLLDTFYRIILANEKAKKIVRLAYDGLVLKEGTYFPDILPQARREPVKKILDRVLKG